MKSLLKSKAGFTLIEAMILAAMLSIIIVTFSSYTFQRARQLKMATEKKQLSQVQTAIKSAAGQTEAVTQTEELQYQVLPTPTP